IPAHMNDWQILFQRYPLIEMAAEPSPALTALPVDWMLRSHLISPAPALWTPIAFMSIAAGFDKLREISVAHSGASNLERRDLNWMRPFLVIKDETLA